MPQTDVALIETDRPRGDRYRHDATADNFHWGDLWNRKKHDDSGVR